MGAGCWRRRPGLHAQSNGLDQRAAMESSGGVGGVEGPLLVPLHRRAARRAPAPAPHQVGGARRAEERVAARPQPRAPRGRHAHHALGLPRPRPVVGPGRQRAAQPLELRQHLRVPAAAVMRAHGRKRTPPRRRPCHPSHSGCPAHTARQVCCLWHILAMSLLDSVSLFAYVTVSISHTHTQLPRPRPSSYTPGPSGGGRCPRRQHTVRRAPRGPALQPPPPEERPTPPRRPQLPPPQLASGPACAHGVGGVAALDRRGARLAQSAVKTGRTGPGGCIVRG